MKARFVPIYFQTETDEEFIRQVNVLKNLLQDYVELLAPVKIGGDLPEDSDAVIFPQMLGDAYKHVEDFKSLPQPILVVTSEFGTVSMWDWEINNYLETHGIKVIAPTDLESTIKACKAIALRKQLTHSKLVVFQDNPGEGHQAEIFKRFYWWEEECVKDLQDKFGAKVIKKSFKALGQRAREFEDEIARAEWTKWKNRIPVTGVTERQVLSALKIYLALKEELDRDASIIAAGINCLNEADYSDTTPCLAWNMLFEDRQIVWGCEADLVVMMTEILISNILEVSFMMTNLYPFLMGMAALKHEHIPYFPEVESEYENHILTAHCGYLGVIPQSFATEWTLRSKVLDIVNDNATAIDARLAEGDMTLVKLVPPFDTLSIIEGQITKYAQFTDSHCLNGAILKVPNGKRMMNELASHHYILTNGHNLNDLQIVGKVFDLKCKIIN